MIGLNISLTSVSINAALEGAPSSLIDLTQPISTGTSDVWSVTSSTKNSATMTDPDGGTARGGWPVDTVNGVVYEVVYDVSVSSEPSGGTYVRVAPDANFSSGTNSGIGQKSGILEFTGTGGTLYVGTVLVVVNGFSITLNNYFVRVKT